METEEKEESDKMDTSDCPDKETSSQDKMEESPPQEDEVDKAAVPEENKTPLDKAQEETVNIFKQMKKRTKTASAIAIILEKELSDTQKKELVKEVLDKEVEIAAKLASTPTKQGPEVVAKVGTPTKQEPEVTTVSDPRTRSRATRYAALSQSTPTSTTRSSSSPRDPKVKVEEKKPWTLTSLALPTPVVVSPTPLSTGFKIPKVAAVARSTAPSQTDEWGDPIVSMTAPVESTAAAKEETDEWGDPIVTKAPLVNISAPVTAGGEDDWGDGPASGATSQPLTTNSAPGTDEWGEPVGGSIPKKVDDWGANDWGALAAKSFGTSDTRGGSSGGYSRPSDGGGGRGRGRGGGRGSGERGHGRGGGGGSREPREGSWDCSCGVNNFPHRRECFKCQAPKPDGGVSGGHSGFNSSFSSPPADEWGDPSPTKKAPVGNTTAAKEETDEWGDPIVAKKAPVGNTTAPVAAKEETDEWGDPISAKKTPVGNTTAAKEETDEWGDPIATKKAPVANTSAPATGGEDDWGDSTTSTSAATTSAKPPNAAPETDEWGDPVGVSAPKKDDDWGASDWGAVAAAASATTTSDSWGSNNGGGGGYSRSTDGGGRGRGRGGGRGRGSGERGRGGGGLTPREPREGDWDCSCGVNNFSHRRECFKCSAPKPDGVGGSGSVGNGGGGYRRRENSTNPNYEPVAKRAKSGSDDWAGLNCTTEVASFDDWGSTTASPKLQPLIGNSGSSSDHTSGLKIKPVAVENKKPMKEWICPDTRCGSANFDWREDCFRCGAAKTSSVVFQDIDFRRSREPRDSREYSSRRRDSRSLCVYSPSRSRSRKSSRSRSRTPESRLKAPPKNLKRIVSILSSVIDKDSSDACTETPKEWSYGGFGLEMNNDVSGQIFSVTNRNTLPLSYRFEAVAQNPGGGVGTATALMQPRLEVIKEIKEERVGQGGKAKSQPKRIIQQLRTTIEAPKTRNKVNSTWYSLRISIEDDKPVKLEASNDKPGKLEVADDKPGKLEDDKPVKLEVSDDKPGKLEDDKPVKLEVSDDKPGKLEVADDKPGLEDDNPEKLEVSNDKPVKLEASDEWQ